MLPEALSNRACSLRPGEEKLAVTVEMEMHGTDARSVSVPPLAGAQRPAPDLRARWTRSSPARRAPRSRGRTPLEAAREVSRALARASATRSRSATPEPTFDFDADGHVTGVRYEEQTESHRLIEQLMILANEQVAGYLADRRLPTLYRVHERPEPHAVAFLLEQLASLDIPTPPVPKNMTPAAGRRPGGGDLADRGARVGRPARVRHPRAARAQAGLLLARRTSATPAWRARATATSPRRSGATRTWSPTARCCRASASTTPPRPRTSSTRRASLSSAAERAAMKVERAADDICLAFLLERRLADADPAAPPVFDGRGRGPDREGRLRALRRRGLRGPAARAAPARLVDAQRAGHRARGRGARDAGCASATESRSSSTASRPPRGRVDLARPSHTRRRDGQEEKAQGRRRGRGHQPPGRASATTCSRSSRPASCCRARRSSRCATARCSSRTPTRRCATARSGCATCTSPPTSPRARATTPSARASCCCTGARSSA